ncbi:MAG TPA: DUF4139 domain-containing protein [bacterium]|nr:DUF4139 domain-containing protein [bacterium]
MKFQLGLAYFSAMLVFCPRLDAQPVSNTTLDDQTGIEVTVYNNNLALIKDIRKIQLAGGEGELRFMDVASRIMPETVHVSAMKDPRRLEVLEQNYEYDLMNETKLLDKYVGKKIKIIDTREFQDRKDVIDATLLSNNEGQIYKIKDEIYLGYPGIKVLPQIPENLIAEPTLAWHYLNQNEGAQEIEVSYLTEGLSWKADYVLVLDQEDAKSDLSGWVTVDNQSGAAYRNAGLKLVAGEVHRIEPEVREKFYMTAAPMAAKRAPQFEEKGFFEYYIYDLQRKTTLKDQEIKQISLLEAESISVQKEFIVYGMNYYFTSFYGGELPKQPVDVFIKFKNAKENALGMPLPAGIMRFYKKDDKGKLQFAGEDRLEHTPKDEEVKLKLGRAFDLVAERKQIDFKQLSTQAFESEWEIVLKNHKEKDEKVSVIEPLMGQWQILSNNLPFIKKDAHSIQFDVTVPKNGETKIAYRVRIGL